jgi:hypothetical protein
LWLVCEIIFVILHFSKESKNMGCIKLSILDQQYKSTELRVSYINKKLTLNFCAENLCSGTLLQYIDPSGMEIDDYFDIEGKYLGSDNAKTDNVRIIDRATWDANKTVNEDGSESIDHKTGNMESVALSESDMSDQQQLSVYQHYNPTDLPLKASGDDPGNKWGMSFVRKDGELSIDIKLEGNKNNKVSDNANEIINLFSHENKHYSDFKKMGESFNLWGNNPREQSAINAQMQHPSWNKTRLAFQNAMKNYGRRFGMTF